MIYARTILTGFIFATVSLASAMNINMGFIMTHNYSQNGYYFTNHGSIQALGSAYINVNNLSGSGSITSDSITISCDTFNYTGTLACNGSCIIYAKKKFDPNMFKRAGSGTFTVIITPYEFKRYTIADLLYKAESLLCYDILNESEDSASRKIQELRTHAAIGDIADQELLSKLKEIVMSKVDYHKDRLDQMRDPVALNSALIASGVSATLLAATLYLYKKRAEFGTSFSAEAAVGTSFITGIFSAVGFGFAAHKYYHWLNPRNKEKYEKYSWLL